MKSIPFINVRWNGAVVIAITSVAILTPASASPLSGPEVPAQTVASEAPAASTTEVKIDNFAFTPGVITVKAGTRVTWINHDDIPHTVDSTEGKFKSAPMDTDDKFQFRFTEPGEYTFYCRMHPKMTGKIVVRR
jgi:plastocyanin